MNPSDISSEQLHWLAGLLEGEGCFRIEKRRIGWASPPAIQVLMTDKDIIEKVASLWSSRVQVMRKRPNRKQAWVTRIFGHKAMAWMKVLKPLMGTRRQQKIAAVIEKGYSPMSHREKGSKGMKVRMTAHYARLNNLNRNLFEA